jgi:hypothetical protein
MVWEFKMPFELNSMENLDFRIQRLVLMFTKKNENNNQYKVDIIQLYQISIYKQEVNRETLCHNPFLGHSQIHFLFFQKKKKIWCRFKRQCAYSSPLRDRGEEDF